MSDGDVPAVALGSTSDLWSRESLGFPGCLADPEHGRRRVSMIAQGMKLPTTTVQGVEWAEFVRSSVHGRHHLASQHDVELRVRVTMEHFPVAWRRWGKPETGVLFSVNHLPGHRELAEMTMPGMFREGGCGGIGFSIGCGVKIDVPGTACRGRWGSTSGAEPHPQPFGSIQRRS
jgi:hypothetical protein